ncbi:hypothetical protein BRADI_4g10970v3 [Brachypodium distachyon]|nr:hypothetical protein BRADI_4g10970v3 [Brachypodium distachyon]
MMCRTSFSEVLIEIGCACVCSWGECACVIECLRLLHTHTPRVLNSMAESHKRMRTSPGNGNAMVVVKKEPAQSPDAGQASSSSAQGSDGRDDTSATSIAAVKDANKLDCSECAAPLKTPIYKCEAAGHKVCSACRGSGNPCRACGSNNGAAASSYTRCGDDLDGLARALKVACPHKPYVCKKRVPCLDVDDHRLCCPDAPCSCSIPPCSGGFLGSPMAVHDHLTGPAHSWPRTVIDTDYRGKALQLGLTLSGPESRQLLVSKEDDSVFVLLAAAAAARVSLTCLRASAAAAAGPHYWAVLWAHATKDPVTGKVDRQQDEFTVQSRRSPREIGAGEDDGTLVSLKRKYLHGCGEEERKILLYVRIFKLKSPSASSSAR